MINKILKLIWALIIIFSQTNCSRRNSEVTFEKFPCVLKINVKEVGPKDLLLIPIKIKLFDSILIVSDVKTEYRIHIFNAFNLKLLCSIGKNGGGPGEFFQPIPDFELLNGILYINDMGQQRFSTFDVSNVMKGKVRYIDSYKLENKNFSTLSFSCFNDSLFMATGGYVDYYKIHIMNLKGQLTDSMAHIEEKIPEIKEKRFLLKLFTSFIAVNTKRNRIVLAYTLFDRLDIYDLAGNHLKKVVGPYGIGPNAEMTQNGLAFSRNSKSGYNGLYVSDKYIYTIYSGASYAEKNENMSCGEVHVFDLEGNPKMKIILDKRITAITVDEKNKKIYGCKFSPDARIVSFDLPEKLFTK